MALAKARADVAVNFQHREAEAQAVCVEAEAVGRRALAVKADVSKAAEVARLVKTVEEVADVVVMLASNGYITGQTISVNGGWHMT